MEVSRSVFLLFVSLAWLCLHLNSVIGLTKSEKWQTYRSFDRMALQGGELWTKHVSSRLECIALCNAENECDATFFHTISKQCKGVLKSKITWENMIKDEDMRFYYKGHPCFGGYSYIGNKCYMYVATSVSQKNAVEICAANRGYLLQVNDESELKLVSSRIDHTIWIDGDDKHIKGAYIYTSGQQVTFFKWSFGEPSGQREENCLEILTNGLMNDLSCDLERPFMCEQD